MRFNIALRAKLSLNYFPFHEDKTKILGGNNLLLYFFTSPIHSSLQYFLHIHIFFTPNQSPTSSLFQILPYLQLLHPTYSFMQKKNQYCFVQQNVVMIFTCGGLKYQRNVKGSRLEFLYLILLKFYFLTIFLYK